MKINESYSHFLVLKFNLNFKKITFGGMWTIVIEFSPMVEILQLFSPLVVWTVSALFKRGAAEVRSLSGGRDTAI